MTALTPQKLAEVDTAVQNSVKISAIHKDQRRVAISAAVGSKPEIATNKPRVFSALRSTLLTKTSSAARSARAFSHLASSRKAGLNWSSQHVDRGGVDGQASWVDDGVDGQGADEVAGLFLLVLQEIAVWARQDSNLRPTDYESAALTS
jgi:hypothetical protein